MGSTYSTSWLELGLMEELYFHVCVPEQENTQEGNEHRIYQRTPGQKSLIKAACGPQLLEAKLLTSIHGLAEFARPANC